NSNPARDSSRPCPDGMSRGRSAVLLMDEANDSAARTSGNGCCLVIRGRLVRATWLMTPCQERPLPAVKEVIQGEVQRIVRGNFFATSGSWMSSAPKSASTGADCGLFGSEGTCLTR